MEVQNIFDEYVPVEALEKPVTSFGPVMYGTATRD